MSTCISKHGEYNSHELTEEDPYTCSLCGDTDRGRMTTPRMSEDDLLRSVIDLAQLLGLRVHHSRPARTAHGWRTAISGHKGLPDLVIVGRSGVLWRELKSATGRLSPDQAAWFGTLQVAGADVALWRPVDWPDRVQDEMEAIRRPRGSVA